MTDLRLIESSIKRSKVIESIHTVLGFTPADNTAVLHTTC